jgi:Transposase IS66 family
MPRGTCLHHANGPWQAQRPKPFADETTMPVLDPGCGRTKTGQLWAYAADDRAWAVPIRPVSSTFTGVSVRFEARSLYGAQRKVPAPTPISITVRVASGLAGRVQLMHDPTNELASLGGSGKKSIAIFEIAPCR